jgi:hypothetical protein
LIHHVKRTLGLEASGLCGMACSRADTCGCGVDTGSPRLRIGVGAMKIDCRVLPWIATCFSVAVRHDPWAALPEVDP